jgi:hypothetical protein
MIEQVLADWKAYLASHDPAQLDALLDDDVVFYSPIVFTPQEGKQLATLYLTAAGEALPGGPVDAPVQLPPVASSDGRFRIVKEVAAGDTAVLEFETTIDGKYVNGVDIIRCNDQGRIVEFRVMIRPLQAVNAVHEQMAKTLEAMRPAGSS